MLAAGRQVKPRSYNVAECTWRVGRYDLVRTEGRMLGRYIEGCIDLGQRCTTRPWVIAAETLVESDLLVPFSGDRRPDGFEVKEATENMGASATRWVTFS